MRVAMLIDSLGAGGAQRQLCLLAGGLAQRGHAVTVVTYHQNSFYHSELANDVDSITLEPHPRWQRPLAVRRALRGLRPDAVVAFLKAASFYAELAALPGRPFRLIAGERVLDVEVDWWLRTRTVMHTVADNVVSNSFAQTALLRRVAPWLGPRLRTVLNGVDLSTFAAAPIAVARYRGSDAPRVLTIGRVAAQKDGDTLIRGFAAWATDHAPGARLDWYGERGGGRAGDPHHAEYMRLSALAEGLECGTQVIFHDPIREVEALYRQADAFVLASRYEGCPNVLIEAMASGVPIIASRVADNDYILRGGECGLLFEAGDAAGLSAALRTWQNLSPGRRTEMALAARARARELFDVDHMVAEYERLLVGHPDRQERP